MKTFGFNPTGFTLVEMAVVLVIVGLLLGGIMTPLSAQMDQRRISETQKALEEINQALIGFAIVNGRLPCPAPAATPTGAAGAGLEPAPPLADGCANNAGVLPWATLGVNETDAWGRRYTYKVTQIFTRTIPQTAQLGCIATPQYAAFALCTQGDMTIKTAAVGGNTVSSTIPAVVISHGKNGNGAFTSQGVPQLPAGADADEINNQLTPQNVGTGTVGATFVSKTSTATFDDLVIWLSPNILFNRMVAAGKLP